MRVLLSLNSYRNLTGSEIYVHELAKELRRRGIPCMIVAFDVGGEIRRRTDKSVKVATFSDRVNWNPTIVLSSQPQATEKSLDLYPEARHVQIVHSPYSYEQPVVGRWVDKYVFVRPQIKLSWLVRYPEITDKSTVIWNGFDTSRFNTANDNPGNGTLFVGTYDHLRFQVIDDLIEATADDSEGLDLVISRMDRKDANFPAHVRLHKGCWDVEKYVRKCRKTAGLFFGRTTIEGFLCGKPAIMYEVDSVGKILLKEEHSIPEDVEKFDIAYMTDSLLKS